MQTEAIAIATDIVERSYFSAIGAMRSRVFSLFFDVFPSSPRFSILSVFRFEDVVDIRGKASLLSWGVCLSGYMAIKITKGCCMFRTLHWVCSNSRFLSRAIGPIGLSALELLSFFAAASSFRASSYRFVSVPHCRYCQEALPCLLHGTDSSICTRCEACIVSKSFATALAEYGGDGFYVDMQAMTGPSGPLLCRFSYTLSPRNGRCRDELWNSDDIIW